MPKPPRNPPPAPQVSNSRPALPAKAGDGSGRRTASPEEVARYIAEFTAELSSLAREADLSLLAYLLDMARLEATQVGRVQAPGT